MMSHSDGGPVDQERRWYDLFSRGNRDWLRHNQKIRDAVRNALPDLVARSDVLSRPDNRTVQVPVRFLEHHRFRLLEQSQETGAGQGKAKPGDVLEQSGDAGRGPPGQGGDEQGGPSFLLEFNVDDILDWLWDELELPNLQPRRGSNLEQDELQREGWDRRGPRARLDRRRTLKEAVKRRTVQGESATPFSNEDLRFRQLVQRRRPTVDAVVFFVLDASASMDAECRKLAKTFFFWVLHGIRRRFRHIDTVFIAHTVDAWEFEEAQFFEVRGEGGTKASSAVRLVREIVASRYDLDRYNGYLFYASDGDNFPDDREAVRAALQALAPQMNFFGYLEVSNGYNQHLDTEMGNLFRAMEGQNVPVGSFAVTDEADIWPAIKAFFQSQTSTAVA
jgi:sporulation protein YhbH